MAASILLISLLIPLISFPAILRAEVPAMINDYFAILPASFTQRVRFILNIWKLGDEMAAIIASNLCDLIYHVLDTPILVLARP